MQLTSAHRCRHGAQSATYVATGFNFNPEKQQLTLAKMLEPLAIRWSRTIPKAARVTTVTVSRDSAGRYFASLLCDDEVEALSPAEGQIGIDMGLNHFLITSAGEKVSAAQFFKKHARKLAKLQRSAARKLEAAKIGAGIPKGKPIPKGTRIERSQNFRKDHKKIAHVHAKIADSRRFIIFRQAVCARCRWRVSAPNSHATRAVCSPVRTSGGFGGMPGMFCTLYTSGKIKWPERKAFALTGGLSFYPPGCSCHDPCKNFDNETKNSRCFHYRAMRTPRLGSPKRGVFHAGIVKG